MKKYVMMAFFCTLLGIMLYSPIVNAASYVLEKGNSIEVRNTSGANINISTTGIIDYACYNLTGSGLITRKSNSGSFDVLNNYRAVITNSGNSNVTLSSNSTAFAPTVVNTPALISGTMEAGKSYEFDSAFSSAVTIYNSSSAIALYDFVCFNSDGTVTTATGIGKDSSLTSNNIPMQGKIDYSIKDQNITYWCAYEAYQKFITVTERQSPALAKGVFEAGKNYKLESLYSKAVSINCDSNTAALYDYATYYNDGTADYAANATSQTVNVGVKGTTYVTPASVNINYWYPYDFGAFVTVSETQNPALYKGVISNGSSYEFDSSYIKNIVITNCSRTYFDYASYFEDGKIDFKRNTNDATITIPVAGTTVITALGSDFNYIMPYEFYSKFISALSSQSPALFTGVLNLGKNYKFSNSFINDIIIANDSSTALFYDYVTLSKDQSVVFGNNNNNLYFTVKESGSTDVTPTNGNVNFWYPYKYYTEYITLVEKDTPALNKGVVQAGKSVEFLNNCFYDIKIFNNGSVTLLYDYTNYISDGTIISNQTYKSGSSENNIVVPKKGKSVITALINDLMYYFPYDLYNSYITVNETSNPALYKGKIALGENYDFDSKFIKNIVITTDGGNAALLDIASYKFDNSVVFNHNYHGVFATATIYPNGRTVISAISGEVKFWLPYDIYTNYVTATKIENPALFVGVLKAGKNYEFTNTDINTAVIANDSNSASIYDYTVYDNDDKCIFDRNTTLQQTTVKFNGRTTVTATHGDINFWYPYDIFSKYITVAEIDTPALSVLKLSPGKTYEFTNAEDISTNIKNYADLSNVFDYTIYYSDGSVDKSGTNCTGLTTNSIILKPGERVIVTISSFAQRQIEFYGAYGTFTNSGIFPSGDAPIEYVQGFIIQKLSSQFTSNTSINAVANISNNSNLSNSATIMLALYNCDQTLNRVYKLVKDFNPNQTIEAACEFQNENMSKGFMVKVFVWNDINSSVPLCESKEVAYI